MPLGIITDDYGNFLTLCRFWFDLKSQLIACFQAVLLFFQLNSHENYHWPRKIWLTLSGHLFRVISVLWKEKAKHPKLGVEFLLLLFWPHPAVLRSYGRCKAQRLHLEVFGGPCYARINQDYACTMALP